MKQFPLTPVEEEGWLCDSRQAVAAQLRANLGNVLFAVAYNEFCAPTLEESVEELIKKGQPHYRHHDDVYAWWFSLGGRDS